MRRGQGIFVAVGLAGLAFACEHVPLPPSPTTGQGDGGAAGAGPGGPGVGPGGYAGAAGQTGRGGSGGAATGGAGAAGGRGAVGGSGGGAIGGSGAVGGTGGGGLGGQGGNAACPCSRRFGADVVPSCPRGADETASAVIGPGGGAVALVGQQGRGVSFTLEIPPRALAAATTIVVKETSIPPPQGFTDYSPVYQIAPDALVLAIPGRLRVPWSNVLFRINQALSIYWSSRPEGPYERVADSYINAGFSQGQLTRAGFVFAGYPTTLETRTCGEAGCGPGSFAPIPDAVQTAGCSIVGIWDGVSPGYSNKLESRASFVFNPDGTWYGGTFGGDPAATQFMRGVFRMRADRFELLSSEGMGCRCISDAGYQMTFDSRCTSVELKTVYDNCTGGRNYLMAGPPALLKRR